MKCTSHKNKGFIQGKGGELSFFHTKEERKRLRGERERGEGERETLYTILCEIL